MKAKPLIISILLLAFAGLYIFFKLNHTDPAVITVDSSHNQRKGPGRHHAQTHEMPLMCIGLKPSGPSTENPPNPRAELGILEALRLESERTDALTGNVPIAQPAAFVDLGDASLVQKEHLSGIQQIAEEFNQKIANSGLDPASPEYRKFWNDAASDSDQQFRARYGEQAWQAHHIQAHHLANSKQNEPEQTEE